MNSKTELINWCTIHKMKTPEFENYQTEKGWSSRCKNYEHDFVSKIHNKKVNADLECCTFILNKLKLGEKVDAHKLNGRYLTCKERLLIFVDIESASTFIKDISRIDPDIENLLLVIFCADSYGGLTKVKTVCTGRKNTKLILCPSVQDGADVSLIFHLGVYMCIYEENSFDKFIVVSYDHIFSHISTIISSCELPFIKEKMVIYTQNPLQYFE
jgi:hypothetical protein